MRLFMDNVPNLAIQAPIIREVPSMFSPKATSKMDPGLIERIAKESPETTKKREEIVKNLEILEAGARTCKEYALRPQSLLHTDPQGISDPDDEPALARPRDRRNMRASIVNPSQQTQSKPVGKGSGLFGSLSAATSTPGVVPLGVQGSSTSTGHPATSSKPQGLFGSLSSTSTTQPSASSLFGTGSSTSSGKSSASSSSGGLFASPSSTSTSKPNTSSSSSSGLSAFTTAPSINSSSSNKPFSSNNPISDSSALATPQEVPARTSPGPDNARWEKGKTAVDMGSPSQIVLTNTVQLPRIQAPDGKIEQYHTINLNPEYQHLSFEELRLQDYAAGRKMYTPSCSPS
ncbi:MAG: hypothetical protein M1818_007746 [Claussenomyces sp. TS43310]|nr:MAG: hypothetical protein M1818_007746 [Claussenomyces sp. TS43310]